MTTWTCADCDAGATDFGWAAADKAAERHTKDTSHSTCTRTTGAIREREGGRVVDRKTKGEGT